MRSNKIYFLFCSGVWILLVIIRFAPIDFPFVDDNYSATRLLVVGQSVTGPDIHVLKGSEELRESIPLPHPYDLNTSEIEMTGKSIYDWAIYPDYYMFNYVITGNYTGLTSLYQETGSGTIPVFQVETITPVGNIASWIEIKLGTAFMLLFSLLFWTLPIFIASLLFSLLRNPKNISRRRYKV